MIVNYKVSEPTTKLINAYDLMEEVYCRAYNALCMVYSEEEAVNMLNMCLVESMQSLKAGILNLVKASIEKNRSILNSDTI